MRARVTLQLPRSDAPTPVSGLAGARVLLVGRGYTARRLEPALMRAGARVTHTTRQGELQLATPAFRRAFAAADYVLVSAGPSQGQDPTLPGLAQTRTDARWIGYLSATSVYGDRGGQWAFEGEAPTPGLRRGRARADAELAWLSRFTQTEVFRLAGIYGPDRSPFGRIRAGTARAVVKPGHIVNRIHVDDIVSALLAAMHAPRAQDILNLADGHPAPPGDVLDFAAGLIGAGPVPRVPIDDPKISAMARSFYAESKRIDAGRAHRRLGWTPRYADYSVGLRAVLAEETTA